MSTETTETTTMNSGPQLEVGTRMRGRVARWKSGSWGFVELAPAIDIFVHSSNLRDALNLRVGQVVELTVARDTQHRLHAIDVVVLECEQRRTA